MKLISKFYPGGRFNRGDYSGFVNAIYPALYNVAILNGMTHDQAERWARFGTYQSAHESGYGTNGQAANYNYGGMDGSRNYGSYDGYAKAYYDMIQKRWPDAFNAPDSNEYVRRVHTGFKYSKRPYQNYAKDVNGVIYRVNKNIKPILEPSPEPELESPKLSLTEIPDAVRVDKSELPLQLKPRTFNFKI